MLNVKPRYGAAGSGIQAVIGILFSAFTLR
jgi:hypothetical protein